MILTEVSQVLLFLAVLLLLGWPLGNYMAKVFQGERTFLHVIARPLEKFLYKLYRVREDQEMDWREYAVCLLAFNILGVVLLFLLQVIQQLMPFNPQGIAGVKWDLALNTAVSFVTNTNWQAYAGESGLSYFVQMLGLTVQNFVSAATGIVVAIALIRGFTRSNTKNIGNFWVDLTKSVLYVLLPIAFVLSLVLVSQGVIQTLNGYETATTLEGAKQTIALGPVASQEAIKELGTNGGGFFNANSSHPFENPTPLTNFLEMLAIMIIPIALTFTFGSMVKEKGQGKVLLASMLLIFCLAFLVCYTSEKAGNPLVASMGVAGPTALEGKETRFDILNTSLFAVVTTSTSCGAVNSMHDSLTPLGGLPPMLLMMLGEVAPGGVGSGLYGILIYAILTVFIIGLMVGRTPEYLGKKIEATEMKMATIAILVTPTLVLLGSALACSTQWGLSSLANQGPHGLSEILYALASTAGNNGSAFGGLAANTVFYNLLLAFTMFVGRFGIILPVLVVAGSLAEKKKIPVSSGTFKTTGMLYVLLLTGVILVVAALTFFPALALGPIVENFLLWNGITF